MAEAPFGGKLPARYTKEIHFRITPAMKERVARVCRRKLLRRSEWFREAIARQLNHDE